MKNLYLIILFALSITIGFSQNLTIEGLVLEGDDLYATDAQKQKDKKPTPLLFATAALYQNDSLLTGTDTDLDGHFKFANLQAGKYKLLVSYVGFKDKSHEIDLVDALTNVTIALDYGHVLEELIIIDYKIGNPIGCVWTCGNTITSTSCFAGGKEIIEEIEIRSSDFDESEFKLYPNPARSYITVAVSNPIDIIHIYNANGQLVKSEKGTNIGTIEVNLTGLVAGAYTVVVGAQGYMKSEKLIVVD